MAHFTLATKLITGIATIATQQAIYANLVPSPFQFRAITDPLEIEQIKKDALVAFGLSEAIAIGSGFILKDVKITGVTTISNMILLLMSLHRGTATP